MPSATLHNKYLITYSEIFVTKGQLKICSLKAWNHGPLQYNLIYYPYNFWNFLSLYCFGPGNISPQSTPWELQFTL